MYANIALWRIAICSPILLAIRKSERDVDVSDLKRKFPENSRVKYIQQIDMLLHTGILFPNPHQPVFIPDPVPTCLYPRPCANLSLSPTPCQPVFIPDPVPTCLYPWPRANLSLSPTPCQPVFIPDPAPTCLYPRPCANLSLFLLLNAKVLSREAANTNDVIVFDPRSIAGER